MNQPQAKAILQKLNPLLPLTALPLIFLMCLGLWIGLSAEQYTIFHSENGVWDLRDFDFENNNARLSGPVEFIPASFLSPQEFADRENEIMLGYAHEHADYSTARIRLLLLPSDVFYTFSRISTDFADRIFVNGIWLHDVGVFADDPVDIEYFTARVTFTVLPDENGMVEIVQQTSNMGQRGRGVFPQDWLVGGYDFYNTVLRADYSVNIVLGAYVALFISFLLLFVLAEWHRPNLYFSLLCLMWFLRTGVTSSARVFAVLVPWLPGMASMRIEYIAMPVAAILIIAIIREVFPGLLHGLFNKGVIIMSAVLTATLLFASPIAIGLVILFAQIFYLLCFVFTLVSFAIKLRKPNMSQIVFVTGMLTFIYGAVRDFTYYSFPQFSLPPVTGTNLTQIATLAFAFCQAAAVFVITMKKVEESKRNERESNERNAALDSLNRMKAQYLANMSHEIKTPLAVILGDIERIARTVNSHGLENKRIEQSIKRATKEVEHIARLTESAIKMAAMQESNEKMRLLDTVQLFTTSIEAYRSLIEKQGNILTITADNNLPQIFGNADGLIGVLTNLLTNANKHTKNGTISIGIKFEEPYIIVTVTDTGIGIAPEILPRIFERGVSGSGSTGMGLAISKQTIEAHGGTVGIESGELRIENGRVVKNDKYVKGTRATFKIPAYDEENHNERLVESDV